jgi:protein SCO1
MRIPKPAQALLLLALAIGIGLTLSKLRPPPGASAELEWLDNPRPVPEFLLTSNSGSFTAQSLRGHWQLVVLGFTHCPDFCPLTLTELADLRAVYAGNLRIIFVSVDPVRDTPQQLANYVQFFGEDLIGLTGATNELHRLAASLGMNFRIDGPADRPTISHSPTVALIGPDGFLRALLRPGFDTSRAARELAARISASS